MHGESRRIVRLSFADPFRRRDGQGLRGSSEARAGAVAEAAGLLQNTVSGIQTLESASMRRNRFQNVIAPFLSASVLAPPAVAQQKAGEILVVGRPAGPEAEAGALSRRIAIMTDGQVARFDGFICVSVLGLPESYAAAVVRDLSQDARSVGLRSAAKGCKPNLTVIFVKDGEQTVRALPAVSSEARSRELALGGPSYSFDSTETKSRDGDILSKSGQPVASGVDRDIPLLQVRSVSIIQRSTRQDLNGVLLVIERSAIVGKTLRQVSAYVTMRGLARASDRHVVQGEATILTLLKSSGDKAPGSLTAFDQAYLAALYRGEGTRDGPISGFEIVHRASGSDKKNEMVGSK